MPVLRVCLLKARLEEPVALLPAHPGYIRRKRDSIAVLQLDELRSLAGVE